MFNQPPNPEEKNPLNILKKVIVSVINFCSWENKNRERDLTREEFNSILWDELLSTEWKAISDMRKRLKEVIDNKNQKIEEESRLTGQKSKLIRNHTSYPFKSELYKLEREGLVEKEQDNNITEEQLYERGGSGRRLFRKTSKYRYDDANIEEETSWGEMGLAGA